MNGKTCFDLTGRVALVTGGRGLYGHPISEGLAEAGATVIVASRNGAACEQYAGELAARGFSARGTALDLGSDASIAEFSAWLTGEFGALDILVNNAVSREGCKLPGALTRELLEAQEAVNVNGTMLLTTALMPLLKASGHASVINISSIQGVMGPHFPYYEPGQSSPPLYTYEKWGVIGYTKWLAAYYGPDGVRVNCISPGGYDPILQTTRPTFYATYAEHTPLKKWPDEDDIKGPIVFLASDAARYITGANLMMDGGFTIW